jgi:deoxyadenosine/deoxycytidine kinase
MTCSLERFESNPFWPAFYDDPMRNAFETEISFLLQHYHQIKERRFSNLAILVCDYSLLLDRAYASTTLASDELPAFLSVYNLVMKRLPPPILIVHLRCDADEEVSRIARRGREVERTATLDLLARLNMAIEQQLAVPKLDAPVVRIDSHSLDFTEHGADREQVVSKIRHAARRASSAR